MSTRKVHNQVTYNDLNIVFSNLGTDTNLLILSLCQKCFKWQFDDGNGLEIGMRQYGGVVM